jgi:hypothetical protein
MRNLIPLGTQQIQSKGIWGIEMDMRNLMPIADSGCEEFDTIRGITG